MGTVATRIRIDNLTSEDIVSTKVLDVNSYDFVNPNQPEESFNDVYIPARSIIEKSALLQKNGRPGMMKLKLTYKNGDSDVFKINLAWAVNAGRANFEQEEKTHDICYARYASGEQEYFLWIIIGENKVLERVSKFQD